MIGFTGRSPNLERSIGSTARQLDGGTDLGLAAADSPSVGVAGPDLLPSPATCPSSLPSLASFPCYFLGIFLKV